MELEILHLLKLATLRYSHLVALFFNKKTMEYAWELLNVIQKKRKMLWHPLDSKKILPQFKKKKIFSDELTADPCDIYNWNSWGWIIRSWGKTWGLMFF